MTTGPRRPSRQRPEQLTVMLLPGYVDRLRKLCDEEGYTVAEFIEACVEMEEQGLEPVGSSAKKKRAG